MGERQVRSFMVRFVSLGLRPGHKRASQQVIRKRVC